MSSVGPLPSGGTWTTPSEPGKGRPTLRGTDAAERLEAKRGENSTIIGGGGGDQLVGNVGRNSFKYEQATDSLASDPDRIFNFNPKDDKIDLSKMLKAQGIKEIRMTEGLPEQVGDVQITYKRPEVVGVLTMKLTPEGENFVVFVDGVHLSENNIRFFKKNQ